MSSIIEALSDIQSRLKSPKDQNAGRYRYRNIEDINEAVKPLAKEHGCAVVYTDRCECNPHPLCVSTCTLTNGAESISADGFACVNVSPKGMSLEQACGSASSYARKYAACGLFAIDSSEKDPDRVNATIPEPDTASVDSASSELVIAKKRLWDALVRWAELNGVDPKAESDEIKNNPDYRPTRAYLNKIAQQYEDEVRTNLGA